MEEGKVRLVFFGVVLSLTCVTFVTQMGTLYFFRGFRNWDLIVSTCFAVFYLF